MVLKDCTLMKINNKLLLAIFIASNAANAAEMLYDKGTISIGYADWDQGVEDPDRGDLAKLILSYSAILDKGEMHLIYEQNHLDKESDRRNYTVGAIGHYRILDSNISAFGKLWSKAENTIGDKLNMFYGVGYLGLTGKDYFFKPYVGLHHLSIDYYSDKYGSANGFNGYVTGWMAGYSINDRISLFNWTDIQLDRNDAFTESFVAQGHDWGLSGGMSVTYKFTPHFSTTFNYVYYVNEMAFDGYGDQLIYTINYDF